VRRLLPKENSISNSILFLLLPPLTSVGEEVSVYPRYRCFGENKRFNDDLSRGALLRFINTFHGLSNTA